MTQTTDEIRRRDRERKRAMRAVWRDRCARCQYRADCTWPHNGEVYCSADCLMAVMGEQGADSTRGGDQQVSVVTEQWTDETLTNWWNRTRTDASAPHLIGAFEEAEDWHVEPRRRPRKKHLGRWEGSTSGTDGREPIDSPLPRDLMDKDFQLPDDPDRAELMAEAREWFRDNPDWQKGL